MKNKPDRFEEMGSLLITIVQLLNGHLPDHVKYVCDKRTLKQSQVKRNVQFNVFGRGGG
jgi:hypothetical protein